MLKIVGIMVLMGSLSATAFARTASCDSVRGRDFTAADQCSPVPAPEIDPASMLTALAMLGGTLAVMRGRRFKD